MKKGQAEACPFKFACTRLLFMVHLGYHFMFFSGGVLRACISHYIINYRVNRTYTRSFIAIWKECWTFRRYFRRRGAIIRKAKSARIGFGPSPYHSRVVCAVFHLNDCRHLV